MKNELFFLPVFPVSFLGGNYSQLFFGKYLEKISTHTPKKMLLKRGNVGK